MRRRRPSRLLICLPLIGIMGAWAFSIGRINSTQFRAGSTLVQIMVADDHLLFIAGFRVYDIPFWIIWLATAILTFLALVRLRRRAAQIGK